MKLVASIAALMLIGSTEAIQRHHHHVADVTFVETLPDERPATVSDADIAAHEAARDEAAKVKKNPQTAFFADVRENLNQISKDLSFGVSFSQTARNDHAKELVTKAGTAILGYANALIAKVDSASDETLTE